MNNTKLKFQLDTCSDVTLINEQTCEKIGRPPQLKTKKLHVALQEMNWNLSVNAMEM